MKCPRCGMSNDDRVMYCQNCHAPLGNTDYRPLPPKKRGLTVFLIAFPIFLILLLVGGIFGYFFVVRTACTRATVMIFDHARSLDFSDIDQNKLPDLLKDQPNLRILMEEELKKQLKTTPLDKLVSVDDLDLDPVIDAITESGSYEITDTRLEWNRCVMKIKTSNKDFSKLPETLVSLLQRDLNDTNSELWQTIGQQIGNIFDFKDLFGQDKGEDNPSDQENPDADQSVDWGKFLLSYLDTAKESLPEIEKEGRITYGFDGMDITGWTIKDYDRDLIRGFYGLEIPDSLFDQFLGDADLSQEK